MRMLALAVAALLSPEHGPGLAQRVLWGAPVAGLRLGLSLNGSLPDSTLRVTLENTDSTEQQVYVALGIVSQLQFVATTRDGTEYPVLDRNAFVPSGGLSLPIVEKIPAGASHQYSFPLTRLIYVPKESPYVTLDVLLQRGCRVKAYLETSEEKLKNDLGRDRDDVWTGRVDSGQVGSNQR